MDPDANLKEQLELAKAILDGGQPGATRYNAERLAELVEALDGWMVKGGFEPRRWRKRP